MTPTLPSAVIPVSGPHRHYWIDARNPDHRIPVVGWRVNAAGPAEPILPTGHKPMLTGSAILTTSVEIPDELSFGQIVSDTTTGLVFPTVAEWLTYIEDEKPYLLGLSRREQATPAGQHPILSFTGKVYKRASWWRVTQDDYVTVFHLPPDLPSPADVFVSKLTREEYFAQRKVLPEVEWTVFTPEGQAAAEAQLPLPFEREAEDDDIGDMI